MAKANNQPAAASLAGLDVPLELMQTFVLVAEHDGDAAAAGRILGISQPSMSRRISALREITGRSGGQPWLLLRGKKWLLTAEGQRVLGVVTDVVRRLEQAKRFIADTSQAPPVLSVACDRSQAVGLVGRGVDAFLKDEKPTRVRLAAPASKVRIEGVAAGQYDFALVTDEPAQIFEYARVELYVQDMFRDRFLAFTKPSYFSKWRQEWDKLPTRRPLRAEDLVGFPLILPEVGTPQRRQIEEWFGRELGRAPEVAVEVDNAEAVLRFAIAGTGVGFITRQSLENFVSELKRNEREKVLKGARRLSEEDFPPETVRLVARRLHGQNAPDLRPEARELLSRIMEQRQEQAKQEAIPR